MITEWDYDSTSGYYCNESNGLYYDPKSGFYYSDAIGMESCWAFDLGHFLFFKIIFQTICCLMYLLKKK